ncbi:MAG: B12-binding domain-containing radical SAM protein [Bacteroidetes bacterium]|nr:B12-binding domain-containing radical SAM protein [Bacteroidota bacterium]
MRNILFSHSYFLRFDPKQWATGRPYAPLGTLYAASLLRRNGYNVSLFDNMFSHSAADILPSLEKINPTIFVLYDDGFNYLTKMCLTNMREAAFEMIKMAKQRNCIVIVSSSDATDHYEKYLQQGADFILSGEAELTLLELVNKISGKQNNFIEISGIVYRQNNAVVKTSRRTVLRDLDTLPLPAWDLMDMEPYRKSWLKHAGYFSMNIATTRGCPFKCNWCAKPIYGNRYNSRSPQNVIAELKLLKEKFNYDHIWFCDDIFGLKPGWVHEFADLVQKENIHFKFKIQARADLMIQENYIRDLARAGCENVWMGAESGSQKILDAMGKGTKLEQIYTATTLLKKNNIRPAFFIQFGYPGETKEDIKRTIRMINKLLPAEIGISVSYPLPGTPFYERVKADLKEKTNWTDSDELALMFHNTYQPAFYKQLHRYVHTTYRKHLAFDYIRKFLTKPSAINIKSIKKATSALYYIPSSFIEKIKLNQLEKA